MKKQRKNEVGITLVALVITIIILLILAGVGITALTQTGLFEKAKEAKKITENAQTTENIVLGSYENKIDEITGSRDEVTISKEEYETLKNANSYSTEEKKVGKWLDGSDLYKVTVSCNCSINGRNWYTFNLGLSKYKIQKTIDIEYLNDTKDGSVVWDFFGSYLEKDNLKVFVSTDEYMSFNYVTLTYTKNE